MNKDQAEALRQRIAAELPETLITGTIGRLGGDVWAVTVDQKGDPANSVTIGSQTIPPWPVHIPGFPTALHSYEEWQANKHLTTGRNP